MFLLDFHPAHLLIAVVLDYTFGDPAKLPHPVQAIARIAALTERFTRALPLPLRLAGVLTWLLTVGSVVCLLELLATLTHLVSPQAVHLLSVYLIFSGLAVGSLRTHALAVFKPLCAGDLPNARKALSMMVGRDTENLDEERVACATIESVGEGFIDGILAPLFFLCIAGPLGMWCYKTINTMDSMFGYRNERYREFGWAPARMDDVVNFIPARFCPLFLLPATLLMQMQPRQSWRIYRRDRLKHPSPNSAHGEAMLAGALGIQLGGTSTYAGVPSHKPHLGDPISPTHSSHIQKAVRLVVLASLLAQLAVIATSLI